MVVDIVMTFVLVMVTGFLPALLWLWLMLKEDRERPEPRMRLILSFLAGMCAVAAVINIELFFNGLPIDKSIITVILAAIEEVAKFVFAYFVALNTKDTDEPVDDVIYMAVTALGFAAFENSLFLVVPLSSGQFASGLFIANARFLGSTLVHLISSGIVGVALASVFYKKNKAWAIIGGLVTATALHSMYNLLIIKDESSATIAAFLGLWVAGCLLILAINRVKHLVYKTT